MAKFRKAHFEEYPHLNYSGYKVFSTYCPLKKLTCVEHKYYFDKHQDISLECPHFKSLLAREDFTEILCDCSNSKGK